MVLQSALGQAILAKKVSPDTETIIQTAVKKVVDNNNHQTAIVSDGQIIEERLTKTFYCVAPILILVLVLVALVVTLLYVKAKKNNKKVKFHL